jgi:hypothetical protein
MTVMPLAEMSKFGEDKNLTNAPKSRRWLKRFFRYPIPGQQRITLP